MAIKKRGFARLVVAASLALAVLVGGPDYTAAGGIGIARSATAGLAGVHPRSMSNGVIAFQGGGVNASLDVINPDGTHLRSLVYCKTTRCGISYGVWSHDGRHMAFVRDLSVFVINADGSGERRLARCAHPFECGIPESLAWAPDDTRLAVTRGQSLFILNVKTGRLRQLTHCVAISKCDLDSEPAWSPDGSKIAFGRISGGHGWTPRDRT